MFDKITGKQHRIEKSKHFTNKLFEIIEKYLNSKPKLNKWDQISRTAQNLFNQLTDYHIIDRNVEYFSLQFKTFWRNVLSIKKFLTEIKSFNVFKQDIQDIQDIQDFQDIQDTNEDETKILLFITFELYFH